MIIDGKKIAEEIKATLNAKGLKLAIVQVGDDENSNKFIRQKIKFAEEIGAETRIYNLPESISTSQLRKKMAEISHIEQNDGVILQLPLPPQISASARGPLRRIEASEPTRDGKTQYVLNGIVPSKDVDVLSARAFGNFATGNPPAGGLPPVVGAVKKIFEQYNVDVKNKNIVVIGAGRLVGKPVATWLINQNATLSVVNEFTLDISEFTKKADIIVSGAGKPGLIKSDMVKDGVIIIDAGSLKGDVEPEAAEKSSLFTPVPGGVGPLTVAMVFKNLIELNK